MNPSALRHRKEVLNVDILQPERCSSQVGDGEKEQVKNRSCCLIFEMVFFCVLGINVEISHADLRGVLNLLQMIWIFLIQVFVHAAGNCINNPKSLDIYKRSK